MPDWPAPLELALETCSVWLKASAKSVRADLKAMVLELAMLLPMTSRLFWNC